MIRRSEEHGVVERSCEGGAVEGSASGRRAGVGVTVVVVILAPDIFRVAGDRRATRATTGALLKACEGIVYLAREVAKVRQRSRAAFGPFRGRAASGDAEEWS